MEGIFNKLKKVITRRDAHGESDVSIVPVSQHSVLKIDTDYKLFKKVLKDQNLFFDENYAKKQYNAYRTVRDNAPYYGDPLTGVKPPMSVTMTLLKHQEAVASLGGVEHFINLIVVPAAAVGVYADLNEPTLARMWKKHALEWSSNLFEWSFMPHDEKSKEEIIETEHSKKKLEGAAKPYEIIIAKRLITRLANSSTKNLPYKTIRIANEFSRVIKKFNSFQKYLNKNIAPGKAYDRLAEQCDLVDKSLGLDKYGLIGSDLTVLKRLESKAKKLNSSASFMAALKKSKYIDAEYKKMKTLLKEQNLNFSEADQKKIYEAYRAVRDRAPSFGSGTEKENGKTPMSITKELIEHKDAFIKLGGFEYFALLIVVPASKMGICVRKDLPVIAEKWRENALLFSQNLLTWSFSEHDGKTAKENRLTLEVKQEIIEKSYPYAVEIYDRAQTKKE